MTTSCLLLMAIGGCKSDGRVLRPARADQNASVSTPAPVVTEIPAEPTTSPTTIAPPAGALVASAPWRNGEEIDARYTCDGLNVAPALSWNAAPIGTVEIAITMVDLDAPLYAHWVIAGLSPSTIALDEDTVPVGAYEALNGAGDVGYTGPCPPAGTSHDYVVAVHYLGAATELEDGSSAADLVAAVEAAETAVADVAGTFSRI